MIACNVERIELTFSDTLCEAYRAHLCHSMLQNHTQPAESVMITAQ
jgi:hypothetical protein